MSSRSPLQMQSLLSSTLAKTASISVIDVFAVALATASVSGGSRTKDYVSDRMDKYGSRRIHSSIVLILRILMYFSIFNLSFQWQRISSNDMSRRYSWCHFAWWSLDSLRTWSTWMMMRRNESQSWRSSWQITIRKLATTNQSESKRSVISTCKRSLNQVGSWSSTLSVGLKLSPKSWLPKLRSEVSDGSSLWKEDFDSLRYTDRIVNWFVTVRTSRSYAVQEL